MQYSNLNIANFEDLNKTNAYHIIQRGCFHNPFNTNVITSVTIAHHLVPRTVTDKSDYPVSVVFEKSDYSATAVSGIPVDKPVHFVVDVNDTVTDLYKKYHFH